MKLFAYNDFILKKSGDDFYGDDSHVLFITHTGEKFFEDYSLGSRIRKSEEPGFYFIPNGKEHLLALPDYASVADFLKKPQLFTEARKILRGQLTKYDVFWLTWPHPISFLLLTLIGRKKPKVLFIRQNLEELIRVRYSGIQRSAGLLFTKAMYAYARRFHRDALVVTVGHEMYERMRSQFKEVGYVSDCIVPQRVSIPARLGFVGQNVKLIFVGRMEPEKGLMDLVDAVDRLTKKYPIELTLVGDGISKKPVEDRIKKLGLENKVQLAGYVPFGDSLFDLYSSHDVMVISSYSEGLPKIINEARAFALPIVSTAVGGIKTELKDEHTVIFVEPKNPNSLASGIQRLIEDPELYQKISYNLAQEFKQNSLEYWSGKFADMVKSHIKKIND
ncbi:glycosyltransferase family 4 protein [Algoriphagus namhaensis]